MTESVLCEYLLDALNDLNTEELTTFKWHLKNSYRVQSSELEKAKHSTDTVDLMKKRFGPEEAVKITADILRKMNQNHLAEQLEKKHKQETDPRTRNDFLKYSHRITLDLNTVNKYIRLSESNTLITFIDTPQSYPDHPDRFDWPEVLCRESVCDRRCYWEIKWSGRVFISVSYKSISRKGRGDECWFGRNDQSWSLRCSSSSYSFRHNKIKTDLPVKPIISTVNKENHYRVGVYVDQSAGTLSFYSVSGDTMSLIHSVQTTFTQPLYPGIGVYPGSSVKLC
ncbi:tripartite motif-containing protein 16-like protein [Megalobrama amblycephala]|uniref:tripartite motif-containing protein 16-like protein n=1 Tax=Megalobrama amblycephala TaxID=75352 RepID=UPI002014628F|nr:tripartite motif-containing protein 16-like protein [Megalobrama amblycephala]